MGSFGERGVVLDIYNVSIQWTTESDITCEQWASKGRGGGGGCIYHKGDGRKYRESGKIRRWDTVREIIGRQVVMDTGKGMDIER